MDPFHAAERILAAELSALLGEAARWDWPESHRQAARLARQLTDHAYAGRNLTLRPELFDELADALRFHCYECFDPEKFHPTPVSPDADHPLDRITAWRKEANDLFYQLYRVAHPLDGR